MSLKREVNILQQENNHLRKLLELADSDSGISFPQENSAAIMASMGLDRNGSRGPLDGRGILFCLPRAPRLDACETVASLCL